MRIWMLIVWAAAAGTLTAEVTEARVFVPVAGVRVVESEGVDRSTYRKESANLPGRLDAERAGVVVTEACCMTAETVADTVVSSRCPAAQGTSCGNSGIGLTAGEIACYVVFGLMVAGVLLVMTCCSPDACAGQGLVPEVCPVCGSPSVQRVSVLYEAGTNEVDVTTRVSGWTGACDEFHWGTARTSGLSQTSLAKRLAPPEKSPTAGCIIVCVIGAALAQWSLALGLGIMIVSALGAVGSAHRNATEYPTVLNRWRHSWMCCKCGETFCA